MGVRVLSLVHGAGHGVDDRDQGDLLTVSLGGVHRQSRDECGRCYCCGCGGDGRRRRTGRGPVVDGLLPLQRKCVPAKCEVGERGGQGGDKIKRTNAAYSPNFQFL